MSGGDSDQIVFSSSKKKKNKYSEIFERRTHKAERRSSVRQAMDCSASFQNSESSAVSMTTATGTPVATRSSEWNDTRAWAGDAAGFTRPPAGALMSRHHQSCRRNGSIGHGQSGSAPALSTDRPLNGVLHSNGMHATRPAKATDKAFLFGWVHRGSSKVGEMRSIAKALFVLVKEEKLKDRTAGDVGIGRQ
jgi:hypothetical protein